MPTNIGSKPNTSGNARYLRNDGGPLVGTLQMYVSSAAGVWTVHEQAPTGNVLATGLTPEPSVTQIASLLRRRGEPTQIYFDRLLKSNDGNYRVAGGGSVADGMSFFSGNATA